jgi:hypothetical protein
MADTATASLVEQIEKDLLDEILKNLEQNSITPEQAEKAAKEFLALLPIEDKHQLLEKLGKYSKMHVEGKNLYMKYAAPIEEEERQQKVAEMSAHIKNGKIEEAINVAKGVVNG